jgi:hypothetical protein
MGTTGSAGATGASGAAGASGATGSQNTIIAKDSGGNQVGDYVTEPVTGTSMNFTVWSDKLSLPIFYTYIAAENKYVAAYQDISIFYNSADCSGTPYWGNPSGTMIIGGALYQTTTTTATFTYGSTSYSADGASATCLEQGGMAPATYYALKSWTALNYSDTKIPVTITNVPIGFTAQ